MSSLPTMPSYFARTIPPVDDEDPRHPVAGQTASPRPSAAADR